MIVVIRVISFQTVCVIILPILISIETFTNLIRIITNSYNMERDRMLFQMRACGLLEAPAPYVGAGYQPVRPLKKHAMQ